MEKYTLSPDIIKIIEHWEKNREKILEHKRKTRKKIFRGIVVFIFALISLFFLISLI